jgi:hypothetical protein
MTELIDLNGWEVFQEIERFIHAAEERELDLSIPTLDRLPMRNVASRTARDLQEAIARRMLSKYEFYITQTYDVQRALTQELGSNSADFLGDPAHILRRRISDCDRRIVALIEEAYRFAMQFSWSLKGDFDRETYEYKFVVSKLADVFQVKSA